MWRSTLELSSTLSRPGLNDRTANSLQVYRAAESKGTGVSVAYWHLTRVVVLASRGCGARWDIMTGARDMVVAVTARIETGILVCLTWLRRIAVLRPTNL